MTIATTAHVDDIKNITLKQPIEPSNAVVQWLKRKRGR